MEIRRNEKYKEQSKKLQGLKDSYTIEYKNVSEAYWPLFDQTKKKTKDKIYLIGICVCLLLIVTFVFIFNGLKNEYLIGASFGIPTILLALAVISYIKHKRVANAFYDEWNKMNKKLTDMQEEIRNISDDLVEEMIMIICFNTYHYNDTKVDMNEWDKNYNIVRSEVLNATSDSLKYDDVLIYFSSWVDNFD